MSLEKWSQRKLLSLDKGFALFLFIGGMAALVYGAVIMDIGLSIIGLVAFVGCTALLAVTSVRQALVDHIESQGDEKYGD